MRAAKAAALLSTLALASSASAEILLDPSDVPIECATICGPVVELTNKCSIGTPFTPTFKDETFARVKRRRVESDGGGGSVHSHARFHGDRKRRRKKRAAVVTNAFGLVVTIPPGLLDGQVFTVTTVVTRTATPSPETGADDGQADVTAAPAESALPTSSVTTMTMTMVVPEGEGAGDGEGLSVGETDLPEPTSSGAGDDEEEDTGEEEEEDDDDDDDDDDLSENAEPQEAEVIADAERECVCQNDSFKVEEVSGLCASCIWQSGYMLGTMENVMAECNFPEAEYTPSSDSVVFNVIVSAGPPTLPPGTNISLVSDSPPSPGVRTSFAGALAVGVACGMAILL